MYYFPTGLRWFCQAVLLTALMLGGPAQAEERLKPYVLASNAAGELSAKAGEVKQALAGQGFTVAGEYSPYDGAQVIVVTSEALRKLAAASEFGGYGAAIRVGLNQVGDKVQVAYVNPAYMQAIYRMGGNIDEVAGKLEAALGKQQAFGAANGFTAAELKDYHYMMFMPYFTDQVELGAFDNHDAAISAVESGLGKKGTAKVYRVDIPGKSQAVFGVALKEGAGADKTVMSTIDTGELRHTAHLPYELLVADNKVYILHGKFRIAQSFPDLGMGDFMKISDAPAATELSIMGTIGK
jgi:hypothetical protein